MSDDLNSALSAALPVRRPRGRPAKAKAVAVEIPVMTSREMALEALAAKTLEEGKIKSSLTKAGISEKEMLEAPTVKQWIYNDNIENINPMMGNFVPRGQEGIFIYTPAYEVTDENKADHIALCKSRINTVAVNAHANLKFDPEKANEGLMARAQPQSVEQVGLRADALGPV